MWCMDCFVGDDENSKKKLDFEEVKYDIEAYYCVLSKNAWLRLLQRSCVKICVKHQKSFWVFLRVGQNVMHGAV